MTPQLIKAKIEAADKLYKEWNGEFWPDKLRQYYEGKQWAGYSNQPSRSNPYVLNLVSTAIETKLAQLLFTTPKFKVRPRPGQSNWNLEMAVQGAQIKEDFLNTVLSDPQVNLVSDLELACIDSFTHFAVVEVGVSESWRNPLHDEPVEDEEGNVVEEYDVPESQRCYVKRIPPWTFRVATDDKPNLDRTEWYGYYEFFPKSYLQDIPEIAKKLPESYKSGKYERGFTDAVVSSSMGRIVSGDVELCKVWHIWSNRTKMRYLYLDGDFIELWSEPFESREIFTHCWKRRQRGFFPIPPVYNWVSPQDEINESREQMRNYRRRFTRKYAISDQVAPEEAEKFANGPDGTCISVPGNVTDKIFPIPNPDISGTVKDELVVSKDDFNIVSATGSETRGQSDRTTATAAKISAQKSEVRDSYNQATWAKFVGEIGAGVLKIARRKLTIGVWVELTKDPGDTFLEEFQSIPAYQFITQADLNDGFDAAVEIDVMNNTPAAQEEQKVAFIEFLTLVSQNPMLAMKPELIRETAYRVGYRNDKVIRDMQQAILLQQTAQLVAGQQGNAQGGNANNAAAGVAEQNQANTSAEVESQLNSQLGV